MTSQLRSGSHHGGRLRYANPPYNRAQ